MIDTNVRGLIHLSQIFVKGAYLIHRELQLAIICAEKAKIRNALSIFRIQEARPWTCYQRWLYCRTRGLPRRVDCGLFRAVLSGVSFSSNLRAFTRPFSHSTALPSLRSMPSQARFSKSLWRHLFESLRFRYVSGPAFFAENLCKSEKDSTPVFFFLCLCLTAWYGRDQL